MTIAFDFTLLHILNAKMSLFKVLFVGFNFDTILKSLLEKCRVSGSWTKIELNLFIKLNLKFFSNLLESISLRFFFFFKSLTDFLSNPFATITSKNILLISLAKPIFNLKLHDIIPPYALIGSLYKASLKDLILFGLMETPQGLACLIIATPLFFGKFLDILRAE